MNFQKSHIAAVALLVLLLPTCLLAQDQSNLLTLQDAEKAALASDPIIKKIRETGNAFMNQSVAAGSWPDPKLKVGFLGLPQDSKDFNEIDMTQKIIGLQQKLPSLGQAGHQRRQMEARSEAFQAMADDRALKVLRGVRMAWLRVYLQYQSERVVKRSKRVFKQLVKITEFQYRAGRRQQHDVFRAKLEHSLLRDREMKLLQAREAALADLNKWVGGLKGDRQLNAEFPSLPKTPDMNKTKQNLPNHPSVLAKLADLKAEQEGVKIESSKYIPSWSIDFTYGMRGGQRSDLLSAVIALDLPVLPFKRQGKRVAANRSKVTAAENAVDDQQREVLKMLNEESANWRRLNERVRHFQRTIMPEAAQNAEATLKAYQNGVTDFTSVVRARLLELESALKELDLRVNRAKAQSNLLYIAGDKTL